MSSQPIAKKPFRFLDLPAEIRNKVYGIILCTVEPRPLTTAEGNSGAYHLVPDNLTIMLHSIEPNILRACRSIYSEALYVMRTTNLFVKITLHNGTWAELSKILISKRLPVLPLYNQTLEGSAGFHDYVMSVDILPASGVRPSHSLPVFAVLYRDLDRFCQCLMGYKALLPRHDDAVSYVVTLVDPYASKKTLAKKSTFFSRKLQETLIAPLRDSLIGFKNFTIKGVVPEDLSIAAVKRITSSPVVDPNQLLQELEDLKAKGNAAFVEEDMTMASEYWSQALMKIFRLYQGVTLNDKPLPTATGIDLPSRLTALNFILNSNLAQNSLKSMRAAAGDRELIHGLFGSLDGAVDRAKRNLQPESSFPGNTWAPSPAQHSKLLYREAVGCRLVGRYPRAQKAINDALRETPGDVELQSEKQRILQMQRW